MGRKGNSKRKPSQNKSKPVSAGNGGNNSISSLVQAGKPGKSIDTSKAILSETGNERPSSGSKKNKKG
jgi:hypothetical protein